MENGIEWNCRFVTLPAMSNPPNQLDGADVICWVVSGRGGFYPQAGSDPPVMVAAMAVARYADEGSFYLFKCDRDWQVVGDWDCGSIEEAKDIASQHSFGQSLHWQSLPNSSPPTPNPPKN